MPSIPRSRTVLVSSVTGAIAGAIAGLVMAPDIKDTVWICLLGVVVGSAVGLIVTKLIRS